MAAPRRARATSDLYEFREERWIELYNRKIDEMIGVLRSKGVPVLWVGLPAVRGPKATSDTLFLDALYRSAAGKNGITSVDVWDGFVDEARRFEQKGPDFEGQIRQLRSADGVYFTKAGARKLAHYVEREITRVLTPRAKCRAAGRTANAGRDRDSRPSCPAAARRADPAAARPCRRYRSTAGRAGIAAGSGRPARRQSADQG